MANFAEADSFMNINTPDDLRKFEAT